MSEVEDTRNNEEKVLPSQINIKERLNSNERNTWKFLFWFLALCVLLAVSMVIYVNINYKISLVKVDTSEGNIGFIKKSHKRERRSSTSDVDSDEKDDPNNDRENAKRPLREKHKEHSVLTEDERLEYHTQVADELYAENIEKNLV